VIDIKTVPSREFEAYLTRSYCGRAECLILTFTLHWPGTSLSMCCCVPSLTCEGVQIQFKTLLTSAEVRFCGMIKHTRDNSKDWRSAQKCQPQRDLLAGSDADHVSSRRNGTSSCQIFRRKTSQPRLG
jgi:hypothetical protein